MDSGGVGCQQGCYSQFIGATVGTTRVTQCPCAAWNLVRAVRSVLPSKQVVMALSVGHFHAVHVLDIQYGWAGLERHSSDLCLSGDALP